VVASADASGGLMVSRQPRFDRTGALSEIGPAPGTSANAKLVRQMKGELLFPGTI
jgi:hypothetical protein